MVTGKGILESLLCGFQLNRMTENYLRTHLGRHRSHKSKVRRVLKGTRESKVMHDQYIRSAYRQLIGGEDMFLWLLRGDLNGETESEIMAAQDQALQTKYHPTKMLQTETDSK
jgi:hypothetical protein